ncbi:hypothetical protein SDJN03_00767, partial [Cucurbita argyrosperma subsp. sororia]
MMWVVLDMKWSSFPWIIPSAFALRAPFWICSGPIFYREQYVGIVRSTTRLETAELEATWEESLFWRTEEYYTSSPVLLPLLMAVREKNDGTLSNSSIGANNCLSSDGTQLDPLMRVSSLCSYWNESSLKEALYYSETLIKGTKTAVQIRSHSQKFFS